MLYMINCRSVTDGVSLSVIKSKLVYSRLIFVDNKLTNPSIIWDWYIWCCLLHPKQASVIILDIGMESRSNNSQKITKPSNQVPDRTVLNLATIRQKYIYK